MWVLPPASHFHLLKHISKLFLELSKMLRSSGYSLQLHLNQIVIHVIWNHGIVLEVFNHDSLRKVCNMWKENQNLKSSMFENVCGEKLKMKSVRHFSAVKKKCFLFSVYSALGKGTWFSREFIYLFILDLEAATVFLT